MAPGRLWLLFLIATIWLSQLCSSDEKNHTVAVKEVHTRQKRWVGAVIQGINLGVSVVQTSLSIGDFATDGAMYYPTINEAKAEVSIFCPKNFSFTSEVQI